MIITLKSVDFVPRLSRETNCFTAVVCLDGVKAGTVGNDGHGGSNAYSSRELHQRLVEYAKTQPPRVFEEPGIDPITVPCSPDLLICEAFDAWLLRSELKRALTAGIMFTKKSTPGLFSIRRRRGYSSADDAQRISVDERFMTTNDVAAIVNLLPFEDAVVLYQAMKDRKEV